MVEIWKGSLGRRNKNIETQEERLQGKDQGVETRKMMIERETSKKILMR